MVGLTQLPKILHLSSRTFSISSGAKIHSNTFSNPVSRHCGAKMHFNTAKTGFSTNIVCIQVQFGT
jgi:hypothetical protein